MAEITASAVKALREKTGAGMMECKSALVEANGDENQAIEILRKKGMASADKKSCRVTAEGAVGSVMRRRRTSASVKDVAMHIAAVDPKYLKRDEVPADVLDKEREILREQLKNDPKNASKPEDVLSKIIEGRVGKYYEDNVLLDQPFVKDPSKTVGELVTEKVASIKENISVRRFTRYKMGEGIEKKSDDFASEVASMIA